MALRLDDKKALVAEVNAVAQKAQSVVAAEYRGLTVAKITELRAKARASKCLHASGEEHAGPKRGRRHSLRVRRREAQGPADSRVLAGRPGRGRAPGQGLREGPRQARADAGVARRLGAAGQGPRPGREPADAGPGSGAAARGHQGPDRQVRAHAGRAPREAGAHHRRGQGPEAARPPEAAAVRIIGYSDQTVFNQESLKWLPARKTSSTRSPT